MFRPTRPEKTILPARADSVEFGVERVRKHARNPGTITPTSRHGWHTRCTDFRPPVITEITHDCALLYAFTSMRTSQSYTQIAISTLDFG